jgi:3'-5' exoribonuclease
MDQVPLREIPKESGYPIAHLLRVKDMELRESKKGFYLMFTLGDTSTDISYCKKWDSSKGEYAKLKELKVAFIKGKTDMWKDKLQITAESMAAPGDDVPQDIMAQLMPTTAYDIKLLKKEFWGFLKKMENKHLVELCKVFLADPKVKELLPISFAAVGKHHPYRGGLLTHIVRLMYLAEGVVDAFNNNMYPGGKYKINKDLVMVGTFLHDLGKIHEYTPEGEYARMGSLIPHLPWVGIEINRKIDQMEDFPEELRVQLTHLVLAHHNRLEWGSPVTPCTLEAIVLHHIDNLASKVDPVMEALDALEEGETWTDRLPAMDRRNAYMGGMLRKELGYDEDG